MEALRTEGEKTLWRIWAGDGEAVEVWAKRELCEQGAAAVLLSGLLGFVVFPRDPQTRTPREVGYEELATSDPQEVATKWARWPGSAIGLVAGRSGLIIFDLDGPDAVSEWEESRSILGVPITGPSVVVKTLRGHHIYFRLEEGITTKDPEGINVLAGKLTAILPPSAHRDEGRYEWGESPFDGPIPSLPDELRGRVEAPRPAHSVGEGAPVPEGGGPNVAVVRELLAELKDNESYCPWLNVGMSLHHGFDGDSAGLDLWDEWSRNASSYEGYGDLQEKWESFGNCPEPRTLARLVRDAKEAGSKITLGQVYARTPPPMPKPDCVVSHDSDLSAEAHRLVSQHPKIGRSAAFSGPPGMRKSTARALHQQGMLRAGDNRTCITLHPTRDRVDEFLADPRIGIGWQNDISVIALKGRGRDPASDFYCSHAASERGRRQGELGIFSCRTDEAHALDCEYLKGWERAEEAMKTSGLVHIAATIDSLPQLEKLLKATGRDDSYEITLDDPGPDFGLFSELELRRDYLETARRSFEGYSADLYVAPFADPDEDDFRGETVAKVLAGFADAALRTRGADHGLAARFLDGLGEDQWDAIARLKVSSDDALPFEPCHYNHPRFGRQLLQLVRLHREGLRCAVKIDGGRVVFSRPQEFLIRSIKEGRVCFLSVGQMPEFVSEALGVHRSWSTWKLKNQVVGWVPPNNAMKGRGLSSRESGANTCDMIFRQVLEKFAKDYSGTLGYLGTKNDHEALAKVFQEHGHLLGHYGADHAGTNRYELVDLMLCRRFRPSSAQIDWLRAAILGAIGREAPLESPEWCLERRVCQVTGKAGYRSVPPDPEGREIFRTLEAQFMLNAVGRCRPLSNPDCRIIVLDSEPVEGLDYTHALTLPEMELGRHDDVQVIIDNEIRSQEVLKRESLIRDLWENDPTAGPKEILHGLLKESPDISVNLRQVRKRVNALTRSASVRGASGATAEHGGLSVTLPRAALTSHRDGGGTLTLSPDSLLILDPNLRTGRRQGLTHIVMEKAGLSRQRASGILSDLREHQGIPSGCRADRVRGFMRVIRALNELAPELLQSAEV